MNNRRDYLNQKVADLNERDQVGKTTIKQIMQREENRNDYKIIRKALKPKWSKGIKYLDVLLDDTMEKWKRGTDEAEIEQLLINRNIEHFKQANQSPFTQKKLLDTFGYKGVNKNSQNLINKKIRPTDTLDENEYVNQFIEKLGEGKITNITSDITFIEFKQAIIKWNKNTTTSPSGRHLGHYKLISKLVVLDNNNQQVNISEIILKTLYNIMMCAIELGNPLQRWTQITTCMIEKVPGVSKINKLRVIHLFEADYNFLLKCMWARKAVWNSHKKNLLNMGQAGSRPGCRAIEVAVMKEMKYTYAKLTRTPLATIDNDAKSCFDRILFNVVMLVSQYYGVPTKYCTLQSTTLQSSEFCIRTALGDSLRIYKNSLSSSVHGTGQGSCASPAIWLFISSFLMDILQDQANGMHMEYVKIETFEKRLCQWIEGFVDDTFIFANLEFGNNNLEELLLKIQSDGQMWEQLLHTTGGELELSKCFYYILS
jgi:Reverse transcriptase (RNA-dependent DNA polymerase)